MAGEPAFSTRWLESTLAERLRSGRPDVPPIPVRVIRREGDRAVAEVEHAWAADARKSWNARLALPSGTPVELVTRRTWGTLRGAKAWLRERPTARTHPASPR
ncbi:MAG: hypothetical protein L3K18_04410 [Thermoplasmata archaeon]|nr:hypothetical protein [Thermoplasmata archaeon]MCI4356369.1 hypothetical protein [Thermoplasmata archaeon]